MPRLPSHVAPFPVPEQDDITLVETGCRLVGLHDHGRTGCARGLTLPSIKVDLRAVDQALEQQVPVIEVPGQLLADKSSDAGSAGQATSGVSTNAAFEALKASARFLLARIGYPNLLQPDTEQQFPSLIAWHCNKQTIAVGHSSSGAVLLYDYADAAGADTLDKAQQVLTHQLQQQVSSLAWRPVHSSMLAVGCEGGVALWSLGKVPLAASSRSGAGGGPPPAGWVTFLPFKKGCRVSSLAWSPDGRLLAGSSSDCNRMMVWDVALGVGANLRLGLQPVTCLTWSPDGNYLFAAARHGRFFLYETVTWSLRSWNTPPGAAITAAAWAPDSSVVLLAMSGSSYLVALHLVGDPQKMTEQMLPIMLPGVSDVQPEDQAEDSRSSCIQSLAWDPTGNRLAVVLGKPHPAAGAVALFSTSYSPVVECNLIGYMQAGIMDAAPMSTGRQQDDADGREEDAHGDTSSTADLHLAYAPVAGKAGGVLSIGLSSRQVQGTLGIVRNVPMYF